MLREIYKMDIHEWKNRYKNRNDISSRLTHLTKGENTQTAFENLLNILEDKKIIGSTTETGFIIGQTPAVCLQEAPLNAIAENLLYEKQLREETQCKVRYMAFGVRFNKTFIYRKGGRPVIYEKKETMKEILPKKEYWRIVNYDLSNSAYMLDWTHEREWRVPGDLAFEYRNIELLVASSRYYKEFITYCVENDKINILQDINGIVCLDTIFF